MSWILVDEVVYRIDTLEDIAEAQAAMREAGLSEADVWVGDADSLAETDTYKNGQKLFA